MVNVVKAEVAISCNSRDNSVINRSLTRDFMAKKLASIRHENKTVLHPRLGCLALTIQAILINFHMLIKGTYYTRGLQNAARVNLKTVSI